MALANLAMRAIGRSKFFANEPDILKQFGSDVLRQNLAKFVGELYRLKTSVGRFAETIGEMTPVVVAGELPAVVRTSTATAALHELAGTLAKHVVAPGVAVQTLEEALPDSGVGKFVKKAYPVVRRLLPAVLGAKRYYLSRRAGPQ